MSEPTRAELRAIAQAKAREKYEQGQLYKQMLTQLPPGSVRLGNRDPQTGKDEVIYEDGGQEIAGKRLFNASPAYGSELRASRPYGNSVVAIDTRNVVIEEEDDEKIKKKKTKLVLAAAVLYAVRETRDYSVDFINPTWAMKNENNRLVCYPTPHGDEGEYPTKDICMAEANKSWQESATDAEAQYQEALETYRANLPRLQESAATSERYLPELISEADRVCSIAEQDPTDDAAHRLCSSLGSYVRSARADIAAYQDALQNPPIKEETPLRPVLETASKKALVFYYRNKCNKFLGKNNLSDKKILEINENEHVEAILAKSNQNNSIVVFKLGTAKRNFQVTGGSGGGGGGTSGGGGGTNSYWSVVDLEAWSKISFFDDLLKEEMVQVDFVYPKPITIPSKAALNYQSWRFANYKLKPTIPIDPCGTGGNTEYNNVVNHQLLTNVNELNKKLEVESVVNNLSILDALKTESLQLVINGYNTKKEVGCIKTEFLKEKLDFLKLPADTIFLTIKPYFVSKLTSK